MSTPTSDWQADLHRRALAAAASRRGDAATQGSTVAVAAYRDPARLALEQALLRRRAQPVAAAGSLPDPGCWLSLDHAGTPLLLVRQGDGSVRALLNVCRHRGARVVPPGAGREARGFVCPYHAWSYQCDGALRGVPQAHGFPALDPADAGLRRLACSERAGLIWVALDPAQAADDLDAQLGPLMAELESLAGLRAPTGYAPRQLELQANWKLVVDGAMEAYHFKVAHRASIAPMFADNLQLIDEQGPHRRLYLLKAGWTTAAPALDGFDARRWGNIIYFFFPNVLILVQPDHAQVSWLEPLDAQRTRVHELTLIPQAPASDKARAHWDANVRIYRQALGEDYALAESIQAGLASGANAALRFGTFEFAAARFHAQLDAALGAQANAP